MTEFIHADVDVDYPVGINIVKNVKETKKLAAALVKRFPSRDFTFWVTGSSGAIMSGIMCSMLKSKISCSVIYIDKPNESRHHDSDFDVPIEGSVNVVLDDFARSFKTIGRITEKMISKGFTPDCLCLGGTIYGIKMGEFANSYPVIIANYISFPYPGRTVSSDGNFDLKKLSDDCIP